MDKTGLNIRWIDTRRGDALSELDALRQRLQPRGDVVSESGKKKTIEVFGEPLGPLEVVERICHDVRTSGIDAVLDYSLRLDAAELTAETLRVPGEEIAAAHGRVEPAFLQTVRRIRDNVRTFQEAILHTDVRVALPAGGYLRQRYLPIERVGICVPGGAAAYPSTLLMTAVPAQAAGVAELGVVAPPTPFGAYNRHVLATCHELGIDEVYRMGGAQAVAALAYGVTGVRRVDKIVGPGNLFVALAKKHVFGDVAIDSIAGPSEVVVIADGSARADVTAADLIAQAEHAPGSSLLISWHEPLLNGVLEQLDVQLATLERGSLARQSLEEFGALLLVRNAEEAVELANRLAPEHLQVTVAAPESLLPGLRNAGAIFLGQATSVALGDYVAGPSHVLPTGGTARFSSGLSANDFLRAGSVTSFAQDDLARVADDVRMMAEIEGLTAHRRTIDIRTGDVRSSNVPVDDRRKNDGAPNETPPGETKTAERGQA
ncbi:MAG: histidinol dehydrogenase [Pirellulales bacterium]